MLHFLIQIPGPLFLFYYLCYSVLVIYAVYLYVRNDYTAKYKVPEPTRFDPLDISILRDGVNGAIGFIIYKLLRENYVTIIDRTTIEPVPKKSSAGLPQDPFYCEAYKMIRRKPVSYEDLLNGDFKDFVEQKVTEKKAKLSDLMLIPDKKVINHYWSGLVIAELLLLLIGGTKLICGINRDKPVLFLLILLSLSLFITYRMFNPKKITIKHTALARKFLKITSQRFDYLLNVPSNVLPHNEQDLSFGVAVFGITPLLGTYGSYLFGISEFINYKEQVARTGIDGSGSGCSGSGCSGSSCSGGGCGGGGCGGCGGD